MKRFWPILMMLCCVACGLNSGDEISDFAQDFAQKASRNDKKALLDVYPDVRHADSLAMDYNPDLINYYEEAPDRYVVFLTPDVKIRVVRQEDGSLRVTESHSLFAYSGEDEVFARQTGLWDDEITDAALAIRMHDKDFKAYIERKVNGLPSEIITIGTRVNDLPENEFMTFLEGYYPLTNNTDHLIKGSDYVIVMRQWDDSKGTENVYRVTGKDIPPHETIHVAVNGSDWHGTEVKGIELNLSPEDLRSKFDGFNGTEYRDYLLWGDSINIPPTP